MGLLDDLVKNRRRLLLSIALVIVLAVFLRFFNIQWSFSNNGIDEGIMLERSLMVGKGYDLYTDLPCDQAPLAFYIGSLFGGEVVPLRMLVAALSVLATGACMFASLRIKDSRSMLLTGVLLSVDFVFLRESRLFSLDALTSCLIAFSIPPFLIYVRQGRKDMLAIAGLLVGLATASKLFGGLALVGMLVFMILEARRDKKEWTNMVADLSVVVIAAAVPVLAFMAFLGPGDMLNGMVFEQGQREFEPFLKLSIVAYFGLNLAYILPLARAGSLWKTSKEVRFLLSLSIVMLLFMILQPLVFLHHMALLSPPLAVLAGAVIVNMLDDNKREPSNTSQSSKNNKSAKLNAVFLAVAMVGIVVSASFASYGLELQGKPMQAVYGEWLKSQTAPDEFVITGDPIMSAYAQRMTPPELVNVAYRQHQALTLQTIEDAIEGYNVSVVIVCYRLNDIDGLADYLMHSGFTRRIISAGESDLAVLDLFQEDIGPVTVYVR
jgi:4-amino-4-deoxy-L-arabinose transferase-like glycosyltransferase